MGVYNPDNKKTVPSCSICFDGLIVLGKDGVYHCNRCYAVAEFHDGGT